MQLLSTDQLLVLEILAADLENRPPQGILTNLEIEALRIALPRWLALERTVTEAHIDAAREGGYFTSALAFPDETSREFLPPFVYSQEKPVGWWAGIKRWWRRQKDEFDAGLDA